MGGIQRQDTPPGVIHGQVQARAKAICDNCLVQFLAQRGFDDCILSEAPIASGGFEDTNPVIGNMITGQAAVLELGVRLRRQCSGRRVRDCGTDSTDSEECEDSKVELSFLL
jgi:hypothetical protein